MNFFNCTRENLFHWKNETLQELKNQQKINRVFYYASKLVFVTIQNQTIRKRKHSK